MNLVQRMRERAEKVKQELDQEREKDKKHKERLERERVAELAPSHTSQNAFCGVCERDCVVVLTKHGNPGLAYYKGLCPLGHEVRREITLKDRYYDQSRLVREERDRHADDFITPNDARFKLLYPDRWREIEREREEREKINFQNG